MTKPKYTHITRDGRFLARIVQRNDPKIYTSFPVIAELQSKKGKNHTCSYSENLKFFSDETKSDMDLFVMQQYRNKKRKQNIISLWLLSIPLLYAIIFLIAWENGDYRKAFDLEYIAAFYTVIIAAAIVIISAITAFYYLILKPKVNRWK